MKNVLLTGATGFVGRQVHRHLAARGHRVRATIRPGRTPRLALPLDRDCLIETDDAFAENPEWWARTCSGIDTVIHAAWYVEHGRYLDAPENVACMTGSFALAQGAALAGVNHVIGIGTCMEYRLPGTALTADAPLDPRNLYAANKLATYHSMREHFALTGTRFSWCRLFYLHGEGEHPGRLGAYLHRQMRAGETAALSAGRQLRDYLGVEEAGRMIASVVDSGQSGAINICSGHAITIRAFAEGIADQYGRRDLLDFGARVPNPADPAAVVGVCNLGRSARTPMNAERDPAANRDIGKAQEKVVAE